MGESKAEDYYETGWCAGCCFVACGSLGALIGVVLFILFGVFALVPAGPFAERDKTLGIVLLVLGVTGVASIGGYLVCAIPAAAVGFLIDRAGGYHNDVCSICKDLWNTSTCNQ